MRAKSGWKEIHFSLPEDVLPTLRLSSKRKECYADANLA